jgi:hypothetical protein
MMDYEWVKPRVDEAVKVKADLAPGGSVISLKLLGTKAVLPQSEKGLRSETLTVETGHTLEYSDFNWAWLSILDKEKCACYRPMVPSRFATRNLTVWCRFTFGVQRTIYECQENPAKVLAVCAGTLIFRTRKRRAHGLGCAYG